MKTLVRLCVLTLGLFIAAITPAHAQTNAANGLITIQAGNLPIILTAPHGGLQPIPDVPERIDGTLTTDSRTHELALAINQRLTVLLGAKPYLVAAKFQRKYLDVNRAPAEAFEDEKARPVYEAYHGQIRNFVDEVRQKYPQGALLIDIHGQQKSTNSIYRGTQNGTTVKRMVDKLGVDALTGTNSVLGRLQAAGYDIIPPNTPPRKPLEDRSFNGGFTVHTYGSQNTNGIDALQCEFGTALRINEARRNQVARDVADAIAAYYRAYLAPAKN